MTGNDNSGPERELTPKQYQLIEALMAGNTIVAAAKIVGIGEKTAHRWLKEPLFNQVYESAKQNVYNETIDKLRNGATIALKALLEHITSKDVPPYVRVQAASKWLDLSFEVHTVGDLKRQLAELKEEIKRIDGKPI